MAGSQNYSVALISKVSRENWPAISMREVNDWTRKRENGRVGVKYYSRSIVLSGQVTAFFLLPLTFSSFSKRKKRKERKVVKLLLKGVRGTLEPSTYLIDVHIRYNLLKLSKNFHEGALILFILFFFGFIL